jgi:hypothetical protein
MGRGVVSVALVTVLQNSREKVSERVKKLPMWRKVWSIRGRRSKPAGILGVLWPLAARPGAKSKLCGSKMPCVRCIAAVKSPLPL